MNFAEALKMLLDELEVTYGCTKLEMISKSSACSVSFSNSTVDTNESSPHLMATDSNNDWYFWSPTPHAILATDWIVKSQY